MSMQKNAHKKKIRRRSYISFKQINDVLRLWLAYDLFHKHSCIIC